MPLPIETVENLGRTLAGYSDKRRLAAKPGQGAIYISRKTASPISYGEHYRAVERPSPCLAESLVNAVMSRRFAKRQQIQLTRRGDRSPPRTRTRECVLDRTLRSLFERCSRGRQTITRRPTFRRLLQEHATHRHALH